MKRSNSEKLYKKALEYFPGGVNSPVRAFKAVEGAPLFIKKGKGPYIWDEDENQFIDFCCSFGPLILGHAHPDVHKNIVDNLSNGTTFGAPTKLESELAEIIISRNPYIDKIRFVSSGTEAVMSGVRLARGFTGRNKILKFEGCYHGHVDSLMVNAGSGLVTFGESSSAGIPEDVVADTIVIPLNDVNALEIAFEKYAHELACVIIEPIPANNGLLLQEKSFLLKLREMCTEHNVLLFFDEVISGFRVAFSGAAEYYDITPDIVSYGKIIGGGLPVGAYGAKKHIMQSVSPDGPVYQAGTLSGNPVAMAAGIAQLNICSKPGFYEDQEMRTKTMVESVNSYAKEKGYDFKLVTIGSIFWIAFADDTTIRSASQINTDMTPFKKLHKALLERSVYVGPSGYEVGFVSQVHTKEVLENAAQQFKNALDEVFG
ncbi:glutamate-1-semialdehyde 2,1-aminomutase [Brumimicrobium oceani]|uniref:Glutamate-1-semialdehyde 2,1-aminomutase n=1 Tax=Brumimicrobium oceani TaxID=2100725 RepID=A0A2U2XBU2_9FLAO|nr:glutamate-1-semialdehyde 2,1-aminomutase [Brumimicrobium oceani]PWH85248.1 glutamate-1-semialdehyde-2,1-aminomutase [Brumimicrobium oceani]